MKKDVQSETVRDSLRSKKFSIADLQYSLTNVSSLMRILAPILKNRIYNMLLASKRTVSTFSLSAFTLWVAVNGTGAQAGVIEVPASGTTQYFDEAVPSGREGTVFPEWNDNRNAELNPTLTRTLPFKFAQAADRVYEIHAVQDYYSAGGQLVPLRGVGNQNLLRIFCSDPFRTLSSDAHDASSSGGSGRLSASVTIRSTDCPSGNFSVMAHMYGGAGTQFTKPLALSINELEATEPQIPAWENPNLDACQKMDLMKAASVKVPMSLQFSCSLIRVR
jgi:hypothetical protein